MFGIDVSHHNGVIDWTRVAKNDPKVDFAYIKTTEGQDFRDVQLLKNAPRAREQGIKIGYYHFASLNTDQFIADAEAEAHDFIDAINLAGPYTLPPALDIEKNIVKLPAKEVLLWINKFIETMGRFGFPDVVIYSYASFLNENLPMHHGLGSHKLWLSGFLTPKNLKLPLGWSKYWIWQNTDQGSITGIGTKVDLNHTADAIF